MSIGRILSILGLLLLGGVVLILVSPQTNLASLPSPYTYKGIQVYFDDRLIKDADAMSFKVLGDGFSEDKNHFYYDVDSFGNTSLFKKDPFEDAASYLKTLVPKDDDKALQAIIASYYDLTNYYGSASDDSFIDHPFGQRDQIYKNFFLPFQRSNFEGVSIINPAFRLAFTEPNSQAARTDFPYPTGAAIGVDIVGKKYLSSSVVLVYSAYNTEEHLGPSPYACKEGGVVIDKFIFKKINGEWKISELYPSIDYWQTDVRIDDISPCKEINQDKIRQYQIN